uniref:Myosin light chain 11 n=1 Tax=Sus scrofa TaxID=9823 RepID=A0A4X1TWJ0_PIG
MPGARRVTLKEWTRRTLNLIHCLQRGVRIVHKLLCPILIPQAPKKAKRRAAAEGSSNVFSMFDQTQIQEFKEAFTVIDQNRDGIIDKEDLRDTFAAMGRLNVKNEELDAMMKEASGPINFTVFLTMFGEKLKAWRSCLPRSVTASPRKRSRTCGQPSLLTWAATWTTRTSATSSRTATPRTRSRGPLRSLMANTFLPVQPPWLDS